MSRMVYDPRTQIYIERRIEEGLTNAKPCAASSATSPAKSSSPTPPNGA